VRWLRAPGLEPTAQDREAGFQQFAPMRSCVGKGVFMGKSRPLLRCARTGIQADTLRTLELVSRRLKAIRGYNKDGMQRQIGNTWLVHEPLRDAS
jgi:hypothetical protein